MHCSRAYEAVPALTAKSSLLAEAILHIPVRGGDTYDQKLQMTLQAQELGVLFLNNCDL